MAAAQTALDDPASWLPERAWTREEFENLTEAEAAAVLLRRLQKLLQRGMSDPLEALMLASKLDRPLG